MNGWKLESSGIFFTHMSGDWAVMTWKRGSTGTVDNCFYVASSGMGSSHWSTRFHKWVSAESAFRENQAGDDWLFMT